MSDIFKPFEILNSSPIVDYGMFLGTLLLLASVIGLPFFRVSANASLIRVTRTVDREKAFAGEYVHVTVKVENTGRRRMDFLEVYDAIPDMFEIALGENFIITQLLTITLMVRSGRLQLSNFFSPPAVLLYWRNASMLRDF